MYIWVFVQKKYTVLKYNINKYITMENFFVSESFQKEIKSINVWDKLVFCDIDWTIYRNSLFLDLVELLIADGIISKYKATLYKKYKKQWKNREIWYEKFLMFAVIDVFEKLIKSKKLHYSQIVEYTKLIIKNNGKHILTYTLNKLQELKDQWYKIIFISGSPMAMVKSFSKLYNFDVWLWTYLWVDNNWYFNGNRIVLASSESKLQVIDYILNKYRPEHTISFWDTNGDYWMLNITDLWVAINPVDELYKDILNHENISVIIERKDLILEMDAKARQYIKIL